MNYQFNIVFTTGYWTILDLVAFWRPPARNIGHYSTSEPHFTFVTQPRTTEPLSLCRRNDRIALRLQEVVKKHVCQIDLPVNVRGTRSILPAETNGDFRVRDRRDYKGRLKSANDSNQTPLVLSRLLLFWRLLSDIVYAAPTKDMVEYSSTVRNTIYNIRKRTIGWKCFFCSDHKRKYEFGRNRHHQSQQPVRLLNEWIPRTAWSVINETKSIRQSIKWEHDRSWQQTWTATLPVARSHQIFGSADSILPIFPIALIRCVPAEELQSARNIIYNMRKGTIGWLGPIADRIRSQQPSSETESHSTIRWINTNNSLIFYRCNQIDLPINVRGTRSIFFRWPICLHGTSVSLLGKKNRNFFLLPAVDIRGLKEGQVPPTRHIVSMDKGRRVLLRAYTSFSN
jgi:hypothetical protein